MITALLVGLVTALVVMVLGWFIASLWLGNIGLIDGFWGGGFVVVAAVTAAWDGELSTRAILVLGCVAAWGLRLAAHLGHRNLGAEEDYRYAEMRARHGARFRYRSLVSVFMLQGVLLWIVSWPLAAAVVATTPTTLTPLDVLGLAVFGVGFLIELVADAQLTRFRSEPANAGAVLDRGLWRYSRHPNYFGDALVWWGLFLMAAATGAWWTVIGPLLLTGMLLKVSGVPLLEKRQLATRPGYAAYVARTSAFIPLPPRG